MDIMKSPGSLATVYTLQYGYLKIKGENHALIHTPYTYVSLLTNLKVRKL